MSSDRIDVEWSARFRRDVTRLRQLCDDNPQSSHGVLLRGLERISASITADPIHCFDNQRALVGDLRGISRCKLGRGRLFYIASLERRMAIILYFGETRRAGDSQNDAYSVIRRLLRSTEFDLLFAKLGIAKPVL
jgi:hypothetical protein